MKPAAYWSPAPVVSPTSLATGKAATVWRMVGVTTTEPFSLRVMAAI